MSDPERWRAKWSVHTAETLRVRADQLGASEYVIKQLLPARQIAILLGDSGLGKSPLLYQAALCVAAGVPFLGFETAQGRVLLADFENGIADILELIERISRYLKLARPPDDLFLWSLNDCESRYGQAGHTLLDMLHDVRPSFAIVDSLGLLSARSRRQKLLRDANADTVSSAYA